MQDWFELSLKKSDEEKLHLLLYAAGAPVFIEGAFVSLVFFV
ncbi:MAG: hypothetical protein R3B47_11875 [Bacteroidia bacterium]